MQVRKMALTASAVAFAGTAALAQYQDQQSGDRQPHTKQSNAPKQLDRSAQHQSSKRIFRLSEFVGREIESQDGRQIGEIENFAVDLNRGNVLLAIVDPSSDVVQGDRLIPVPYHALELQKAASGNQPIVLNVQAAKLRNAPNFSTDSWPNLGDQQYHQRINQHYNISMSDQGTHFEDDEDRQWNQRRETTRRDAWDSDESESNYPSSTGNPRGGAAGDSDEARDQGYTTRDERDRERETWTSGDQRTVRASKHNVLRVSDLMDASIVNRQNQDLGDIQDVLFEPSSGQIVFAVVSAGGFMGMGDDLLAVPVQAFNVQGSVRKPQLVLDIDRNRMESAPTLDRIPTTHDPALSKEIIAFYDVPDPQFVYGFAEDQEFDRMPDRRAQDQRAQQGTMRGTNLNNVISNWPQAARRAAQDMLQRYGQPDDFTNSMLVWTDAQPFKKIIVYREGHEHNFPVRHMDVLEQCVEYRVPADRMSDLAEFDGSLIVYRTGGILSARCHMEPMNILALNLAHEIVSGRRSPQEARQFFARTAEQFMQGESSEYTQELMFQSGARNAADPDQQWRQGGQQGERSNRPMDGARDRSMDDNRWR